MPGNKRPRKGYRPRTVWANAHELALARVHTLHQEHVATQLELLALALQELPAGVNAEQHWRNLADASNVAEQLLKVNICSGQEASEVIYEAQSALAAIRRRMQEVNAWTVAPAEAEALAWLLALHRTQLQACDHSEFARALDAAHTRVSQARAGNAPRDAVIVTGEIE